MKHYFILNPAAGKGKAEKEILPVALEEAKNQGLDYAIHRTVNVGEATSFVRRILADNPEEQFRFYAIGGDGTISEVASGMLGFPNAELAVIQAGSGNDFVKMFGDVRRFHNMKDQLACTVHPIDLIRINGRICANMINIGLDAATAETQMTLKQTTPLSGPMTYIAALGKHFAANKGAYMRIEMDDGTVKEGEFTLMCVGNGAFCGGGFQSAPYARLDDGLLEVSVIEKVSRLTFLSLVGAYHAGTHLENERAQKFITYRRCKSLVITMREENAVCIDGEIVRCKEAQIDVLPNAIRFCVPNGCGIR